MRLEDPTGPLTAKFMLAITQTLIEIAKATGGEVTYNTLLSLLKRGEIGSWILMDGDDYVGTILYDWLEYDNGLCLVVTGAAGNLQERYEEMDALLTEMARTHGATAWEIKGRRGWVRAFRQFGAVEKMTTLRREI